MCWALLQRTTPNHEGVGSIRQHPPYFLFHGVVQFSGVLFYTGIVKYWGVLFKLLEVSCAK